MNTLVTVKPAVSNSSRAAAAFAARLTVSMNVDTLTVSKLPATTTRSPLLSNTKKLPARVAASSSMAKSPSISIDSDNCIDRA